MNSNGSSATLGRLGLLVTLAAGLVLGDVTLAGADRGRAEGRHHDGYENRDHGRDKKSSGYERHQRVTVIRELPREHRKVRFGRVDYYVHRDHYYRPSGGVYAVVSPPIGAVVATLPLGHGRHTIGGALYFSFGNTYYRPHRHGYQVVRQPAYRPQATMVTVATGLLNVRSGPGSHFPVIDQVGLGDRLLLAGDAPGWHYVELPNGACGWVMSRFVGPAAAG